MTLPSKVLRVRGCALIADGDLYVGGIQQRIGPAECSCGERSEDLPTKAARQAWHSLHRLALRPPAPCRMCHEDTPAAVLAARGLCESCADGEDYYASLTPAEWAARYADENEGM